MESYEITGGYPLVGDVTICGAKNVALKVLIAALLTEDEVVVENVPLISDLYTLAEIVSMFRVKIEIRNNHTMTICAKNFTQPAEICERFNNLRASFLLMIPMLVRFGEMKLPSSGGDKIGIRPIDRTLKGLSLMGASIDYYDGYYRGKVKNLTGTKYFFSKNTHTGTEAMIMAAATADGTTILDNASYEPEVDELIKLINLMGGKVKRSDDPRKIVVIGVKKLHGTTIKIIPDRNEAVTFAIASILTHGKLRISPVVHSHMETFYNSLKKISADFTCDKHELIIGGTKRPIFSTDIETAPYPGFMTDWQAPWAVLMTQAEGLSTIHEKVFDNRFGYVSELLKMGAKIELFNPDEKDTDNVYNFNFCDKNGSFHAARILGLTKLHGADLLIPDLRAGATLVLAALSASGNSKLLGVSHIDRGYENFDGRLRELGAKITRLKEI